MKYISADRRFSIQLTVDVINDIKKCAIDADNFETGGVLIGKYSENLKTAEVLFASGPPPDSKSGKCFFYRGTSGLSQLFDKWKRNGCYYLGEWHFHPFSSPSPSPQDIRQMKGIAKDKKYNCPESILLIIGEDPRSEIISLNAFIFFRECAVIQLSKVNEFS